VKVGLRTIEKSEVHGALRPSQDIDPDTVKLPVPTSTSVNDLLEKVTDPVVVVSVSDTVLGEGVSVVVPILADGVTVVVPLPDDLLMLMTGATDMSGSRAAPDTG
jgi:hypothetical protein